MANGHTAARPSCLLCLRLRRVVRDSYYDPAQYERNAENSSRNFPEKPEGSVNTSSTEYEPDQTEPPPKSRPPTDPLSSYFTAKPREALPAAKYRLKSGRYEGRVLGDLARADPEYLRWLRKKVFSKDSPSYSDGLLEAIQETENLIRSVSESVEEIKEQQVGFVATQLESLARTEERLHDRFDTVDTSADKWGEQLEQGFRELQEGVVRNTINTLDSLDRASEKVDSRLDQSDRLHCSQRRRGVALITTWIQQEARLGRLQLQQRTDDIQKDLAHMRGKIDAGVGSAKNINTQLTQLSADVATSQQLQDAIDSITTMIHGPAQPERPLIGELTSLRDDFKSQTQAINKVHEDIRMLKEGSNSCKSAIGAQLQAMVPNDAALRTALNEVVVTASTKNNKLTSLYTELNLCRGELTRMSTRYDHLERLLAHPEGNQHESQYGQVADPHRQFLESLAKNINDRCETLQRTMDEIRSALPTEENTLREQVSHLTTTISNTLEQPQSNETAPAAAAQQIESNAERDATIRRLQETLRQREQDLADTTAALEFEQTSAATGEQVHAEEAEACQHALNSTIETLERKISDLKSDRDRQNSADEDLAVLMQNMFIDGSEAEELRIRVRNLEAQLDCEKRIREHAERGRGGNAEEILRLALGFERVDGMLRDLEGVEGGTDYVKREVSKVRGFVADVRRGE